MKKTAKKFMEKMLAKWARRVLVKNPDLEIIGVTGSVGKSSTKEAIYEVLKTKYHSKVGKSEGNMNTEIGLPLVILGFTKSPHFFWQWIGAYFIGWFRASFANPLLKLKILILEYAADRPGDIGKLLNIVKPKIAVITKISAAHTLEFKNLTNIANEKGKLAWAAAKDGLVILNKDNDFTAVIAKKTQAKIQYFHDDLIKSADHIAYLIGKYYQLNDAQIKQGLADIKPLPGRLNIIKTKNYTIIDDTYNANPESMKRALAYLEKYKSVGRKIAVLGDMLELGDLEKQAHQEIIQLARKKSDLLVTVGPKFQNQIGDAWFSDASQSSSYLLSKIKKNDTILVKGSRAMRMEEIIKQILHQ